MMKKSVFLILAAVLLPAFAQDQTTPCRRFGRMTQCVTVPLASTEADRQAKLFEPPPAGMARIYIIREYTIEPLVKSEIFVDKQPVGYLAPQTYAMLNVPPGTHSLMARTDHDFGIELHLESGQTYFVKHQLTLWLNTITGKLKTMEPEKGRMAVLNSKRALAGPN